MSVGQVVFVKPIFNGRLTWVDSLLDSCVQRGEKTDSTASRTQ
jgi:hypothetical protein